MSGIWSGRSSHAARVLASAGASAMTGTSVGDRAIDGAADRAGRAVERGEWTTVAGGGHVVVERDDRRRPRGELEATGRDSLESFAVPDEEHKPKLRAPSIVVLVQSVRPSTALTDPDRDAAIDAMRIAAEKRTDGILGNSTPQNYGHAALLVASCAAYAPKNRAAELLRWAIDLRQQHRRRHACRAELARACEPLGVLVPA
jgi:hypothetical protein